MQFPTITICGMCDQQSLRSACANAQSDPSLCYSLEYSMIVKLLTEHQFEFLSLKGGCTGSSESTLVKMPLCLKSHFTAHIYLSIPSVCGHCLFLDGEYVAECVLLLPLHVSALCLVLVL